MMPIVAVCVYCSQKIEEKEKSVDVPHLGGIAHLACAQKVAIRTAPGDPVRPLDPARSLLKPFYNPPIDPPQTLRLNRPSWARSRHHQA